MPQFKIIPIDQPARSAEITAIDAGSVLAVVNQLECREADVLRDGAYAFSVRLSDSGMWSIFQQDTAPKAREVEVEPSSTLS